MKQTGTDLWKLDLGATYLGEGTVRFKVWAPRAKEMSVKLLRPGDVRTLPMDRNKDGYFSCSADHALPGEQYFYVLDGGTHRPDPCSRFQAGGIHGPSTVIDPAAFSWTDSHWKGIALSDLILYEIHVGTFTPAGTFEAITPHLTHLKELGITAVELMPIAQFPGKRNWGYDGVDLFSVHNTYGSPETLKKFVDACHQAGIAVCLDVVYNHLGPEGNYLHDFGPYFTQRYHTPWGDAVNFDGSQNAEVRNFFISNALYWVTEYHIDALRLDAAHMIFDQSQLHILAELNTRVKQEAEKLGRTVLVIGESDINDPVLIRTRAEGGYELDGQWSDDFHHSLHTVLTGEKRGYYKDYSSLEDVAKAIKSGFVYDGKHSAFRGHAYGKPAGGIPGEKFIVCVQNHDHIGNRGYGDRLSTQISFAAYKAAAALLLMSPATPMLFMGEEYGEHQPFHYFVDHSNAALVKEVVSGRRAKCAAFDWHDVPNPTEDKVFLTSKLNWSLLAKREHQCLFRLYQDLIRFRHSIPGLSRLNRKDFRVYAYELAGWIAIEYPFAINGAGLGVIVSFSKETREAELPFQQCGSFEVLIDTNDIGYGGTKIKGPAQTAASKVTLQGEHALVGKIK